MAKSIFILNKAKYVLQSRAMRMLHCTLILPYISYCVEIWGNTYKSNTKPLYILQKRAIRIIHKADYREHTNMLFVSSGLLKWQELVQLQTLVVMFKAKSKTLPAKLQKMFFFTSEDEDHRRKGHFKHQCARTTVKQMCISVVRVKLWNSLYNELKDC